MIFLTNGTLFGLTIAASLLSAIPTCIILSGIVFYKSGTPDTNKNKSQEQRIDAQSQIIDLSIGRTKQSQQKISNNIYLILRQVEENINTIQNCIKNISLLPKIHDSQKNIHSELVEHTKILDEQFVQVQEIYNKLLEQTNTIQQIYNQADNLKKECSLIISHGAWSELASRLLPHGPPLDHQERLNSDEEDEDDKPIRVRVIPD